MERHLNIENLNNAMVEKGLSQSALASELDVSRETVSKWLKGIKFPRPDKLLRLGLAVGLGLNDLVTQIEDFSQPVVAFRKRGNSKTTNLHITHAMNMGKMLSPLVPYLPNNQMVQPSVLKSPVFEYEYIQSVCSQIREELNLESNSVIDQSHLIKKFDNLQATLIPVLWGEKEKHENALHIYLPDSMTTWVYLNLDVKIHDFKFWMAHELGHIYSPELRGEVAEDFADAFAGALIFPESLAKIAYEDLLRSRTEKSQIVKIKKLAEQYKISLITIYYEIRNYATHHNLESIGIGSNLFAANTFFNKKYKNVSDIIFKCKNPDAKKYISVCENIFSTKIFNTLKNYLAEQRKSAGFIQCVLDTPLLDAKGIHAELS